MINGYFRFENQDDALYLNIYAPADGGMSIDMEQFVHYIDKVNITPHDLAAIRSEIMNCETSTRIKVGEACLPSNEWGEYTISQDKLHVEVVFYPAFIGASTLTAQEIIKDLQHQGIIYGIKPEVINELIKDREYFTKYEIVAGTPPV